MRAPSYPLIINIKADYGLRPQENLPRPGPRRSHLVGRALAHEQAVGGALQGGLHEKLRVATQAQRATAHLRKRGESEGVTHRLRGSAFLLHGHSEADQLPWTHIVPE
jgi:hypothetical protein